jgi:hypothetical protein
VKVTTFCYPGSPHKKIQLFKIGLGEHLSRPASQLKEKLDPPTFQMQTDPEGQSNKDSLLVLLFNKPPQTQAAATTKTAATLAPDLTRATPFNTTSTAASSPLRVSSYFPEQLSSRFNIASPNKPKLAMELIFEMDTSPKMPLMRDFVKGSTTLIETHKDQPKSFVDIPKCWNEAYALSQTIKY